MIEVRVDFNARGADGLVKASVRRASGPLTQGVKVLAKDPDEGLRYVGVVHSVDTDSGRVMLEIEWNAAVPDQVSLIRGSGNFTLYSNGSDAGIRSHLPELTGRPFGPLTPANGRVTADL